MIGIYKITNPKGKVYVGQSRNIEKRFNSYKNIHCRYQIKLKCSLIKYGVENHKFEIIEECELLILNIRERYWQDFYNCIDRNFGLNLILTQTDDLPRIISEETKRRMSIASSRPMSEETKDKIRESKKYLSDESKQKMSLANKGIPKSEEHKEKLRISKIGKKTKPMTEEQKKIMSKMMKGRKMDRDIVDRISYQKRKIILNTQTGIFYFGILEASHSMGITKIKLAEMLLGRTKNKTFLIYV